MSKHIVLRTPFNGQIFNKKPYNYSLTQYQKLRTNLKNTCVHNRLETVGISIFSRLVFVVLVIKLEKKTTHTVHCILIASTVAATVKRKCSCGKITGQI